MASRCDVAQHLPRGQLNGNLRSAPYILDVGAHSSVLCAPLEAFFRLPETVRRTAFDAPSPLKEPFKTMPDVPEPPQGFARVAARSSHRKEREERKALGGSWSSQRRSHVWLL